MRSNLLSAKLLSLATMTSATFLALVLALPVAPARAATITYSDPNCADFVLSGPAGARTLTCVKLACAATATPATPGINDAVTLSVACTPSATQYSWALLGGDAGCSTTFSTNSQAAIGAPGTPRSCIYRATSSSGQLSGVADITVNWTNAPPPPPTGCSITRTPASGSLTSAGGPISVAGACSGGGAVTSWAWQKNGVAWQTGQNQSDTLPANTGAAAVTTTYTLTACNGPSCAAPVQATFSVAGVVAGFCGQYNNVISADLAWVNNAQVRTDLAGGLKPDGVFVVKIDVSAGQVVKGAAGSFNSAEYGGNPTQGQLTVSTQPCDFRNKDATGANGPFIVTNGQSLNYIFDTGTPLPKLAPGATYYVNVRNWDANQFIYGCTAFECNRLLELKLF